jgi:hypothetical protein
VSDEGSRFDIAALGVLGAFFILLNAGVDLYAAAVGGSYSAPLAFSNDFVGLGLANALIALSLVLFVRFYSIAKDQTARGTWCLLVTVFAAFSLWSGGGFLVGFVLSFTAGAIGIILTSSSPTPPFFALPTPVPSPSPNPMPDPGIASANGAPTAAPPTLPPPLSGVIWYCRRCECDNPTDSRTCRHCGTRSPAPS